MTKRINSKKKGKVGELEFAHLLKSYGYGARRGVQYSGDVDAPDVICETLPIHWEVKRVENLNLYDAIAQADRDCPLSKNKLRVVAHRKNRHRWLFTLEEVDFFRLLSVGTFKA